jgi:hypothetical protein
VTSKDVTSERAARLSNGGIAPFRVTDQGGGKRRSGIGAKVMRPPTEAAYGEESHGMV